jgi:hypothetical protein
VVKAAWALSTVVLADVYNVPPVTIPGGNPSTVTVGDDPTSPVIVVAPVFVIPLPARTAKLAADPRATAVAAIAGTAVTKLKPSTSTRTSKRLRILLFIVPHPYLNIL